MVISKEIDRMVDASLAEDIGSGDMTTAYVVPPAARARAKIVAGEDLVVCGLEVCRRVFRAVDPKIRFKVLKKEGSAVKKGANIVLVQGRAAAILTAERTALNFLKKLSGVASLTRRFTVLVKRYKVKILDTRKTTPGLRSLQKYAVRVGGGYNHRKGLWDEILIKENHLEVSGIKKRGVLDEVSLANAIKNIKKAARKKVELEVESLNEFKAACRCSPDSILLDNFTPANMAKAVAFRNKRYPSLILEASGGIDLKNVVKYAATGVDHISIGALTHSARACHISLEIV
ncbi:carboxylating nicotinate-nucleotide diphosphorylase [Candidatus Omnitrophota bacterium]